MDGLTANEAAALRELEFNLSAPHSAEEIAAHLGCSVRHVNRIETRALAKLRKRAAKNWSPGDLHDPSLLTRRTFEVFPSNGMTPKDDTE